MQLITVQALLAANWPGREMRQRLVFEAADRELDDGMLTMLGNCATVRPGRRVC